MEPFRHAITGLCQNAQEAMRFLMERYNEAPMVEGITGRGGKLFELWRNADGTTWSVVFKYTTDMGNDVMCMLMSGTDLTNVIWHLPGIPL